MEIEKSKVLIQFLLIFRQTGDVFSFLYARRLRGYTATLPVICERTFPWSIFFLFLMRSAPLLLFHIENTSVKSVQDDQSPVLIRTKNDDL